MISVSFKRPPRFAKLGQDYANKVRRELTVKLVAGLQEMQESIMLTPVYTGKTLVNYHWSLGRAVTTVRPAVKDPGLPGTTSEMDVGKEPRRAANAAVVVTEFRALIGELRRSNNPFQTIYLTNTTPYFNQVEYGTYTTSAGHGVRTPPGGMVRRGESLLEATVSGLRKRG